MEIFTRTPPGRRERRYLERESKAGGELLPPTRCPSSPRAGEPQPRWCETPAPRGEGANQRLGGLMAGRRLQEDGNPVPFPPGDARSERQCPEQGRNWRDLRWQREAPAAGGTGRKIGAGGSDPPQSPAPSPLGDRLQPPLLRSSHARCPLAPSRIPEAQLLIFLPPASSPAAAPGFVLRGGQGNCPC